jgi:hypothetical protein
VCTRFWDTVLHKNKQLLKPLHSLLCLNTPRGKRISCESVSYYGPQLVNPFCNILTPYSSCFARISWSNAHGTLGNFPNKISSLLHDLLRESRNRYTPCFISNKGETDKYVDRNTTGLWSYFESKMKKHSQRHSFLVEKARQMDLVFSTRMWT